MTRAAGYFRVSSDAQPREDRNSLDVQRAAFARQCAARGYDPAGEYQDVMSGRRNARPGYQQLLAAARSGDVDVIVVTWLDRAIATYVARGYSIEWLELPQRNRKGPDRRPRVPISIALNNPEAYHSLRWHWLKEALKQPRPTEARRLPRDAE